MTRAELYLVSFDRDILETTLIKTLGSENAACFAYFLSQHKAELDRLTIDWVTVFRNDGSGNVDPDLVFHVTAVSQAQVANHDHFDKSVA